MNEKIRVQLNLGIANYLCANCNPTYVQGKIMKSSQKLYSQCPAAWLWNLAYDDEPGYVLIPLMKGNTNSSIYVPRYICRYASLSGFLGKGVNGILVSIV